MPQNTIRCGWRGNLHQHANLFCYYMFFEIINSLKKMNLPYVYTLPFSIWFNVQFLFYRALDFTLLNHAEWKDFVPRQIQWSRAKQDNYDHPPEILHHIQFYLVKPNQFIVEAGYLF